VIPFFLNARATGTLPITDSRMTRFWITLEQGVDFVLANLARMKGGEIFVPKIPSMSIIDVAKAIAPECNTETIGIRPGEKLHELMVGEDDSRNTVEYQDYFAILPSFHNWTEEDCVAGGGRMCADGFRYSSEINDRWLSASELRAMIGLQEEAVAVS
jgi:UDP-N-acetylglucosamine 4,6-dehydratase